MCVVVEFVDGEDGIGDFFGKKVVMIVCELCYFVIEIVRCKVGDCLVQIEQYVFVEVGVVDWYVCCDCEQWYEVVFVFFCEFGREIVCLVLVVCFLVVDVEDVEYVFGECGFDLFQCLVVLVVELYLGCVVIEFVVFEILVVVGN